MSTRLIVEEIAAEDRTVIAVEGGREIRRGNSLAMLVREIGGFQGEFVQPSTGERFPISLERWRDRDPDNTWLVTYFHIEPPEFGATEMRGSDAPAETP